jgi:ABC-type antimicrobial peptide transport system permease subunit
VCLGESTILTLGGGIAGFLLAPVLYRLLLTRLLPPSWGLGAGLAVSWPVMALALLGAVVLNLLFSLLPAAQAARTDIVAAIRTE